VHGYMVEAPMTLRQAMEPVLAMGGLAVRDGIAGLSIGAAGTVVEIGEIVADGGALITRRRPDAGEAVGRVALGYGDRERDYQSGSVTAIAGSAGALESVGAGLVLDIGGARYAAERVLGEHATQREIVELTLPPSMLAIEIGDAIEVAGEKFEVVEIRDGLARRVAARSIVPAPNVDVAGERPGVASSVPAVRAVPVVVAAQLPPSPEDVTHSRLAAGAFARPWPSEVSVTDEGTGAELAALERRATLGVLTATLAAGSMFIWDEVNAIELEVLAGHLASRDDADVQAGANRIAVETDSGDWEIIGFAEAELVAPRCYRLTRLLRGQGGSDHAIGAASAGNRVMVLDGRVATEPIDPVWLGETAELLCFAGPSDGVGVATEVEIGIAAILPLSPVHLLAEADGSDIAIGWVRRSRADTDSWATEDAPFDWSPEAYRFEIYDGVTLVRTIESASSAVTYTAAQQTSDFGGPATSFGYRVAQVSALYGPGHWATGDFHA